MSRRSTDDENDDEESKEHIDENEEFYLNGGAEHIPHCQVGSVHLFSIVN
jgi:hypothetical protein